MQDVTKPQVSHLGRGQEQILLTAPPPPGASSGGAGGGPSSHKDTPSASGEVAVPGLLPADKRSLPAVSVSASIWRDSKTRERTSIGT